MGNDYVSLNIVQRDINNNTLVPETWCPTLEFLEQGTPNRGFV